MRLRTFTAPDMPTAMRQVREALGDDAVILSSQTHKAKKGVTVTAAIEEGDAGSVFSVQQNHSLPPNTEHRTQNTEPLRFHIQELLRFHNIPELFIAKIMNADRDAWQSDVRLCLEKLLAAFFSFEPLGLDNQSSGHPVIQSSLMLIGPPGIGKTLTIARIAAGLAMDNRPVLVITTDTKRAGGIEQLQAFTNILDIPLAIAAKPKDLRKFLDNANERTCALIDTAGCNPYDPAELAELAEFANPRDDIEPVLALPAGGDSLEAIDAAEAFMSLPVKKLLVTRADTARRFGGVIAAAAAHGLAFCNASSSSSVTDRLLPVDEALLAQFLLRYQLQSA